MAAEGGVAFGFEGRRRVRGVRIGQRERSGRPPPRSARSARRPGWAATSASGWGSTPARPGWSRATTSASRSTARRASRRRATAARSLVTDATRAVAGEPPAPAIVLRDLGEHRLKDFARPERLYQVEAAGLETTFPALRTLDLTPNNLPPQLTSFVGREREVDNAVAACSTGRAS